MCNMHAYWVVVGLRSTPVFSIEHFVSTAIASILLLLPLLLMPKSPKQPFHASQASSSSYNPCGAHCLLWSQILSASACSSSTRMSPGLQPTPLIKWDEVTVANNNLVTISLDQLLSLIRAYIQDSATSSSAQCPIRSPSPQSPLPDYV